jgi:hypothetical protein
MPLSWLAQARRKFEGERMGTIRKQPAFSCAAAATIHNSTDALMNLADYTMEESARSLPSFFIVGPPRTGTTWIHEVLRQHVNLPSPTKETRFFDVHFQRGLKWYRAHFPALSADRPTGEIAPTYFASTQARERIAQTVPEAKLVFVFRNPVQRVISLYRVKRAYGMYSWDLEQALDQDPELIASGMYATSLRDWQRAFRKDQTLVTLYDDLRKEPQSYVDRLTDFICIPRIVLSKTQLKRSHSSEAMTEPRNYLVTRMGTVVADWLKARRLDGVVAGVRNSALIKLFIGGGSPFKELSQDVLQRLAKVFRPEVDELETILGRDLSAWKTVRTSPIEIRSQSVTHESSATTKR